MISLADLKDDQIAACEKVIELSDKAIEQQATVITEQEIQAQRLSNALNYQIAETARLSAEKTAWYRQPQYVVPVSIVLGFIGGVYVGKR
jgi:uncharacterized protein (DUF3084 family)